MFRFAHRARLAAAVTTAAAALALVPSAASAQVRFGTLLGTAVTKISDVNPTGDNTIGDAIRSKSRVGFQLGGYLLLPLSGGVSLQPELHYIQKGTKVETSITDVSDPANLEASIKLGYVEIPVLLRADLGSRGIHPFIVAGPSFALRTSCKLGLKASGTEGSFSGDTDCDSGDEVDGVESTDPLKKTDIGGIVGAGFTTSLAGRSFSAQFRYGRSFTNVAKEPLDNAKPRNSGFSVLFGIGF